MSVFDLSAKYYDLLYENKDYTKEAAYIDAIIKKFSPNTGAILELGCGSGKYTAEFARLGYKVSGIDFSNKMVANCKSYFDKLPLALQNKLKVCQGDIRDFDLNKKYGSVVSLFHVMSYQITNADLKSVFANARKHLHPEGMLIFDCWYGPGVLTDPPERRIKQAQNDNEMIIRIAEPVMRPNDNIVDINYHFLVKSLSTGICDEFKEVHRMRYFFEPEVKLFLEEASFDFISSLCWLKKESPGFNSWNAVFVAKAI